MVASDANCAVKPSPFKEGHLQRCVSSLRDDYVNLNKKENTKLPSLINNDDKQLYHCVFLRKRNEDSVWLVTAEEM